MFCNSCPELSSIQCDEYMKLRRCSEFYIRVIHIYMLCIKSKVVFDIRLSIYKVTEEFKSSV